jgi:ABC-2 type transport system ATP-binding protein
MWDVIRRLVLDGTTLLLTTQYLEEADQLADVVCVMESGRVLAQGTPAELKAGVGDTRLVLSLPPGTPFGRAAAILAPHAAGPVTLAGGPGRLAVPVIPRPGIVTEVVRDLDAAGIAVDDISMRQPSLDDVFHALTGAGEAAA